MPGGPDIFTYQWFFKLFKNTFYWNVFGKKIIITNPEAKIPRYFSSLENIQYLHENPIVNKNNLSGKKKIKTFYDFSEFLSPENLSAAKVLSIIEDYNNNKLTLRLCLYGIPSCIMKCLNETCFNRLPKAVPFTTFLKKKKNITALKVIHGEWSSHSLKAIFKSLFVIWPKESPWSVPTLSLLPEILPGRRPFILGIHSRSILPLRPVSKE